LSRLSLLTYTTLFRSGFSGLGQPTLPGGFMAVRGEEVAGSIEAHVREAIERMVGEIRSSVEDVRVAVDSQLKAALQSVQADVNSDRKSTRLNSSHQII